jgi:hypothetical protein
MDIQTGLKVREYMALHTLVVQSTVAGILREEHGLGAFEKGVLREVFGHKREEVTGD